MLNILNLVLKIGIVEVFYALLYHFHKSLSKLHYKSVQTKKHDIKLEDKPCSIFDLEKNSFSFFTDSTLKFKEKPIWSVDPISKIELKAGCSLE